jgi:serine/threonine protein kinase
MATAKNTYEFLEPAESKDELGRLAHYRVLRELGRGGMGYVFQAEDAKLKRSVALKVMNQKVAATVGSRQRFISEARAMAAIRHDNVATIFEVGQRNETPFMAMEMLTGQTLESLNRSGVRLGFRDIIRYAKQITEGLAAAHARGIVHRDIKPANIWIEAGIDRIKILDFGLALASTPVDTLAGRGSVIGTPGYLSPEQARTEPLDDRSDLYSLGAVLYEMCTGKLPIGSKSIHEQLIAILIQKPKPIAEFNREIPEPLNELIQQLLKKEPRARIESATTLLARLAEVESACERSTDVAQTIDRLKSGLSSVLEKKSTVVDSMPTGNPFDAIGMNPSDSGIGSLAALPSIENLSLPTGLPSTTSFTGGSGVMPAIPYDSSGSIPIVGGKRVGVGGKSATSQPSKNNLVLPLAILAVVAVIALPVLTFFFSGIGASNENVVILPEQPTPQNANNPSIAPPAQITNTKPSPPQQNKPPNRVQNGGRNQQKSQVNPPPKKSTMAGSSSTARSTQPMPDKTAAIKKMDQPAKVEPGVTPPKAESKSESKPKPQEKPTQWKTISTSNGGADAMVQSGSAEKFGENITIGIRSRGGVEVNHSYLRFKLKGADVPLDKLVDARVSVNVVGKWPVGAKLRLFGVNKSLDWPESQIMWKNSFSAQNLGDLLLLAETTVSGPATADNWVQIGSPELADFIRQGKFESLTLILAGEFGDQMLRLSSKEKNLEMAPKLELSLTID